MKSTDIPNKFPIPFGNAAAAGTIRPIPQASQTGVSPGAASLTDGFPTITGQALASGGIPPSLQDFNGLLNQMSAWNRWQAAAGLAPYDANFSTAVGGYPSGGAVLSTTTPGRVWVSTADNNTTNPDSGNAANWLALMLQSDVLSLITANSPTIAKASVTLWVRTDGNDSNNGSANTAASAFQTIGAAVQYGLSRYVFAGFSLIIRLGLTNTTSNPYTPPGIITGASSLTIQGDPAAQGSYVIGGAGPGSNAALVAAGPGTQLNLTGVLLNNTGSTNHTTGAVQGGSITLTNVTCNMTVTTTYSQFIAFSGGNTSLQAGCQTNGTTAVNAIINASSSAVWTLNGTLAINGPPSCTTAVALCSESASVNFVAGSAITGTPTGQRYNVSLNGVINTNGGGANFFPGTVAGAAQTGGQYV